jgi:hypothetical protein
MLRSFDISLGSGSVRLVLNTIGIRLATSNTNPGHINPDFLRVNEIVPGTWDVERPVTLEAGFSRINYNNGVSVAAAERYVLFSQRNLFNPPAELVVADLATRYLECSPTYLSIASVTFTPGCLWVPSDDLDPPSESPLSRLAIPFGDVHPRLFVRSSYQIEGNLVEVALSDDPRAGGEDAHFFRVNGWVTFRFPGRGSVGDAGPSREALAKLPTAVHQFYEVAAHLCTQYSDLGA